MSRTSPWIRWSHTPALAIALALHLCLFAIWASQRAEPPPPPSTPFVIRLALVPPPDTPTRIDPNLAAGAEGVGATSRSGYAERLPAPTPRATLAAASDGASPVATPGPPPGAAREAPPVSPALRNALARRLGCANLDRLPEAERIRCGERYASAPAVDLPETNGYALVAEHAGVMAGVRSRENAVRASCEGMRNLNSSCPSALPVNLPRDFEPRGDQARPKPRSN